MTQESKDYLHLHFIVLIWGFTAILGFLINLPPVEVVFYRTLIASGGLYILIKLTKKGLSIDTRKDYAIIFGTGALIALHWVTFFLSARISNVSVSLAGMATCSLWTAFIEPLSQGRRVKGYEVVLSIIAFIGIAIIFNAELDFLSGLIVAIFSAFLSALFSVINGGLVKKYDPYVITYYEMVGACISIGLFFPIYAISFSEGLQLNGKVMDFVYLTILAVACTVYAYSASVQLMKRISVFTINLTVNLEPIYGIILALIIFGQSEEMSGGFYFGTGLILVSVLLYPMLNRRFKRKALSTDLIR
ncbi:MAG: DMT family transporter [Cyclobacteriaceae bacterium]